MPAHTWSAPVACAVTAIIRDTFTLRRDVVDVRVLAQRVDLPARRLQHRRTLDLLDDRRAVARRNLIDAIGRRGHDDFRRCLHAPRDPFFDVTRQPRARRPRFHVSGAAANAVAVVRKTIDRVRPNELLCLNMCTAGMPALRHGVCHG